MILIYMYVDHHLCIAQHKIPYHIREFLLFFFRRKTLIEHNTKIKKLRHGMMYQSDLFNQLNLTLI